MERERRWLLWIGRVEGATLVTLLFVAVPLKRLAGVEWLPSALGPVHGATFVLYFHAACAVVFDGRWTGWQVVRVLGAAIVPFGTFVNEGMIRRGGALAAGIEGGRTRNV